METNTEKYDEPDHIIISIKLPLKGSDQMKQNNQYINDH